MKKFSHLPVMKSWSRRLVLGQLTVYVSLSSLCITDFLTLVTRVMFLSRRA